MCFLSLDLVRVIFMLPSTCITRMAGPEIALTLLLNYLTFHSVLSLPQSLHVMPTNISVPNNLPANL